MRRGEAFPVKARRAALLATLMALTHINLTKGLLMEIIKPRITVQNTNAREWLITVDDLVTGTNGIETISFSVLVPKGDDSLPLLTRKAVQKAVELLQQSLSVMPAQ